MAIKKAISGIIYILIIIWAAVNLETKEISFTAVITFIPILMIWFPEEINNLTLESGNGDGPVINKPTPAFLISGFGWLVLLVILFFIFT